MPSRPASLRCVERAPPQKEQLYTQPRPIESQWPLNGKKVSVQVGTKSVNYLKDNYPKVDRVEVEKNQEMFNLVEIGRGGHIGLRVLTDVAAIPVREVGDASQRSS